jgi:hypothetical protein
MSDLAAADPAASTNMSTESNVNEKESGYEVVEVPTTR